MNAPMPVAEAAHSRLPSRAEQGVIDQIHAARTGGKALIVRGNGSKAAYRAAALAAMAQPERIRRAVREPLFTTALSGIVNHQPGELFITARAATPVREVMAALAAHDQHLPFEAVAEVDGSPATLGGLVATAWAGPARAYSGSVRDHVLGARLIDGQGRVLQFGGQVMKNVAGYDVSRLLVGSWGLLGVLSEVSLKVLPQPLESATLRWACDQASAITCLNAWAAQPLPLAASAWWAGTLVLRLAGSRAGVEAAIAHLSAHHPGAERVPDALAADFWQGLAEQRDDAQGGFFADARAAAARGEARLWRLALPATTPPLAGLSGVGGKGHSEHTLIEWGGALRWLLTHAGSAQVHAAAQAAGGSARLWWGKAGEASELPANAARARIERALMAAFDPAGVFA